jgi:tRNA-2-methylthio-N6-dimethylallyladenosine synthase
LSERKAHIATFGCQMNTYDSSRIAAILSDLGFVMEPDPHKADLVLVNTCSVREKPVHKVRSFLGMLKHQKENNPNALLGVCGCVAQQEGDRLLKQVPFLDMVFGPRAIEDLPQLLEDAARGKRRAHIPKDDPMQGLTAAVTRQPGLKALVTIMQGCDNFCSYCVVPYVRGREKSRPSQAIYDEAAALVNQGVREITLLGQNVNSYHDPQSGGDFADLLHKVSQVPDLWRIRFATSHPKDLSDSLIQAIAGIPSVMEQLHLPAQSGSDRILKAMNRGYGVEHYLARVARLREKVPGLALGGDMIIGFPGETDEDHAQSLELLKRAQYDFLYSFIYSDRPFAKAGSMTPKVGEETKRIRLNELQDMQRGISLAQHQAQVGKTEQVLAEGPDKKGSGLMTGRTRAGRAVNFKGGVELTGSLVKVEITAGRINSLMGCLVTHS